MLFLCTILWIIMKALKSLCFHCMHHHTTYHQWYEPKGESQFCSSGMVQNIKEGGGRGVARWNNNQLINGNCVLGSLGFYQTHGRVINIESRVWAPIMEWFGAETVPTVSQSLARSDAEVTIELSTNFAKFHNIWAKKNLSRHYIMKWCINTVCSLWR